MYSAIQSISTKYNRCRWTHISFHTPEPEIILRIAAQQREQPTQLTEKICRISKIWEVWDFLKEHSYFYRIKKKVVSVSLRGFHYVSPYIPHSYNRLIVMTSIKKHIRTDICAWNHDEFINGVRRVRSRYTPRDRAELPEFYRTHRSPNRYQCCCH